jgi:phosphopantothenoylcysteine decarboxylase/phosphopantothenate--cysteine ligase
MRPVESADEMLAACLEEVPCDIAIFAAAVADWKVARASGEKIKKSEGRAPSLSMVENPDILKSIATLKEKRPTLVVGFAAETGNLLENAREKLERKGCDLIIANDVSVGSGVFGGEKNKIHVVSKLGVEIWPEMSKRDIAFRLMQKLAEMLPQSQRKS